MNKVPQLKPEFYTHAESSLGVMSPLLAIINRALELQYAAEAKCRAVQQPEPVEPQQAAYPQPYKKEPHAELKAMYEQQVKDGTVDDFVWSHSPHSENWFDEIVNFDGFFIPELRYRCTPKPTCQVKNLDTGKLKTMTRESAKKLQAELGDTVDWFYPDCTTSPASEKNLGFACEGIYTYKLKPTVKLTIDDEPAKMLTPAQCEAEMLARIDTHDLQFKSDSCAIKDWLASEPRWFEIGNDNSEYRLIRKQPKQISWKNVPVGVMTNKGELRAWSSDLAWCETKKHGCPSLAGYTPSQLELAPAAEQPWIAVQDCKPFVRVDGLQYVITYGAGVDDAVVRFKVTGLAEGWVLK